MRRTLLSLLIAFSVAGPGAVMAADDISKINGTASVEAGQTAGDVHTVNGSVKIGARATVAKASTVNGSVDLGEGATAGLLGSVCAELSGYHDIKPALLESILQFEGKEKLVRSFLESALADAQLEQEWQISSNVLSEVMNGLGRRETPGD